MGKGSLNFWIYSYILIAVFLFVQCANNNIEKDEKTKKVADYLKKKYEVNLQENIQRIFIVNDMGCGNCILSFSEFIKSHCFDDSILVILNSRGTNVDLNAFEMIKRKNPNIVINHNIITEPNDLFYHSGVVYLDKGKVDTIIHLQGEDLLKPLQYVFSRK